VKTKVLAVLGGTLIAWYVVGSFAVALFLVWAMRVAWMMR